MSAKRNMVVEANWSAEDVHIGKLLLAVADMQSFVERDWTSAQARHNAMPTGRHHWTRAQMRHSSALAVHARPVPEESPMKEEDVAIEVFVRRKKLSDAWAMMQSCDPAVWTDVCDLHNNSMVVAVEADPSKFKGVEYALKEVAEARALMKLAELLAAVETIEDYNQEEWKAEQAPACVRRGSLLMVHDDKHHTDETAIEARVRHLEHAQAWQKMKEADPTEWQSACRYHEERNKSKMAKREKLDAACWVLQDFDAKAVEDGPAEKKVYPKSMKHAACLTVHAPFSKEPDDPVYRTHRQRLLEAWETMKETDPKEWQSACKEHEKFVVESTPSGITRKHAPVRNGVGNRAA